MRDVADGRYRAGSEVKRKKCRNRKGDMDTMDREGSPSPPLPAKLRYDRIIYSSLGIIHSITHTNSQKHIISTTATQPHHCNITATATPPHQQSSTIPTSTPHHPKFIIPSTPPHLQRFTITGLPSQPQPHTFIALVPQPPHHSLSNPYCAPPA